MTHTAENDATPPVRIEGLARLLHVQSTIGRFVGWEALPSEAHEAYMVEARQHAAVLFGVVASEVVDRASRVIPPEGGQRS